MSLMSGIEKTAKLGSLYPWTSAGSFVRTFNVKADIHDPDMWTLETPVKKLRADVRSLTWWLVSAQCLGLRRFSEALVAAVEFPSRSHSMMRPKC